MQSCTSCAMVSSGGNCRWSSRQSGRCTRSSPAAPTAARGSASSTRCATGRGCGPAGTGARPRRSSTHRRTRRRHRAPIQPRLGWRQENERRQATHCRGCERPAARRRRHRRPDPGRRRRAPDSWPHCAVGSPPIRLAWADGGYPGRLPIWTTGNLALPMQIIKRIAGTTGFHVRARVWVVERSFEWINSGAAACETTKPDPTTTRPWVHIAMIATITRRLART
ncbi:hypothetical protein R1CP_39735 (plasmid) [Rhodococcus opacus]|uniref:Transposase n=1 Tax=Rhodococcus opacus TaxID=37919 RepID=A0A1B1KIX7_RHOOP|nr:hypothetical protein R1CP_39735 [Rhodococcus opacus]